MAIQTAEIIENKDGQIFLKASIAKNNWIALNLTRCAEDDHFGVNNAFLEWAKLELEKQKGLRPDRCETCRFWQEVTQGGHTQRSGECRKKPPRILQEEDPGVSRELYRCPITTPDFWCGQWESAVKEE